MTSYSITCAVCGEDCGSQIIYIDNRPYCTGCAPVVNPRAFMSNALSVPTGSDFKRLREWIGITPEVCADRLGVTAEQLVNFEIGIADVKTFAAIKAALGRLLGNGY